MHMAIHANEMGKDGCVIASSGADMNDDITCLRFSYPNRSGMQARLAIVDPAIRGQPDEDILIKNDWIVGLCDYVSVFDPNMPRTPADKLFALDVRKCINDL